MTRLRGRVAWMLFRWGAKVLPTNATIVMNATIRGGIEIQQDHTAFIVGNTIIGNESGAAITVPFRNQ